MQEIPKLKPFFSNFRRTSATPFIIGQDFAFIYIIILIWLNLAAITLFTRPPLRLFHMVLSTSLNNVAVRLRNLLFYEVQVII